MERVDQTRANALHRVDSTVQSSWEDVEKGQHPHKTDTNETAWRRWMAGPMRYYASWLFPLSALVGVCSEQVVEFFASNTATLGFVWNRLAWTGLSKSIVVTILAYSGAMFAFGFLPMSDTILGRDTSPPVEGGADSIAYRIPLYLFVPMHLALLAIAFYRAPALSSFPTRFVGVVLSLGCSGGLAFTAAHELLHGRRKFDRFLCGMLLCPLFYMHWANSHLSHHRKVGTPEDPATARFGESLFHFVPRSVTGNIRDAIDMERKRLASKGKSFMHFKNRFFLWMLAPVFLSLGVYHRSGAYALVMLFGSALFSIIMLESVNYIEHYGLERKRLANGKYEPVGQQHSWNADWIATSAAIFQLQRHSHHHAQASLPYQALRSISNAPLLPASYPVMMLTSFCPPLFFKCMNARVEHIQKDTEMKPSSQ
ncbi:hypothetical protein BSKO_04859 [Bryopsis sp. KO-2023]|nr:hypothetical protein BSKO_04859 [Bryopsis sp. KO-2023]